MDSDGEFFTVDFEALRAAAFGGEVDRAGRGHAAAFTAIRLADSAVGKRAQLRFREFAFHSRPAWWFGIAAFGAGRRVDPKALLVGDWERWSSLLIISTAKPDMHRMFCLKF